MSERINVFTLRQIANAKPTDPYEYDGDDRHERDCPEWEPSDNELMNRPGVEGGIGYPLSEAAYDEHDWRL